MKVKKVGWISVKTPPKESGWYFTCVEVNGVPQCLGVDYYNVITKEWEDDDDDITNVDYWMPIPELPKRRKRNEQESRESQDDGGR